MRTQLGFTLIEILVVIGMIAVLASIVLVAINPMRQFAQARNSQRIANVNTILNAIGNRVAEHRGLFADDLDCSTQLPGTTTEVSKTGFDIRPCLVPTYLSELPYDPTDGSNTCRTAACGEPGEDYETGYTVLQDPTTGRVTVCAPGSAEPAIDGSKTYCLTR